MNQQPFISTQLNIFDDNRCVFSSSSIGGQPVMISQEQNRKICDTVTTSIAANQSHLNPSHYSGPQLTPSPNQSQFWPSAIHAQRQGVPGGFVFNFSQPNYSCPPSCIPSTYNPPPPPAPQIMEIPFKTPQSICVDFAKYGMEAMIFQQKCRQQSLGFTYDKQVGTADQNDILKTDTCSCGVQPTTLNAEQKGQLFHRIDETDSKAKLNRNTFDTNIDKKRCICFPKPDPNKFGSAKNLVIGERKERSCKEYDIVERATREADAEAYLCYDCLDKWKNENENKRPSCLRSRPKSNIEKQNQYKHVSISLSGNALEISENKQPRTSGLPSIEHNSQNIDLKNKSSEAEKKSRRGLHQVEWIIETIRERRRRLLQFRNDFDLSIEDYILHLDADEEVFNKIFELDKKEIEKKMDHWKDAPKQESYPEYSKYSNFSEDFNTLLTVPSSAINETTEETKKQTQTQSIDSDKLETVQKKNYTNGTEKKHEGPNLSPITKLGAYSNKTNTLKPQSHDEKTESTPEDPILVQLDPPDFETKLGEEPKSIERENQNCQNLNESKDPILDQRVEAGNEKPTNEQSSSFHSTTYQMSDEENLTISNPEVLRRKNNSQLSQERAVVIRDSDSVIEDQMDKVTIEDRTTGESSRNNLSTTEVPEASTLYQNNPLSSNKNEVSSAQTALPVSETEDQNLVNKQDEESRLNQSNLDPQTPNDALQDKAVMCMSCEIVERMLEAEEIMPEDKVGESIGNSIEVDKEDGTTCEETTFSLKCLC